jgi:outer membrane protein OmpA-like peptidoglycan-associated protein
MKKKNLFWVKEVFVIGVACISMSAYAEEATVWIDSAGDVVTDGDGHCLHTIWWKQGATCGNKPSNEHVHGSMQHTHEGGSEMHEHKKTETISRAQPEPKPVEKTATKLAPFSLSSAAAFETSGSKLSVEGQAEVKDFAEKLEGRDVSKITVDGYTDSSGSSDFNQKLSEKRANAVKDEMVKNGIDASLITVVGHGENDPVASNETAAGRAQNRRVTVKVEGKGIVD